MREEQLTFSPPGAGPTGAPLTWVHTLVIGSGAAGLNAACQLRAAGVEDVLILTEGLHGGTSINIGSDKQTYYKLSLCGGEGDVPRMLADTYFAGGGMHGDLALAEASLSARAFLNLVNLGVPFPRDPYGQFVGYKTDHDPRQRATSVGPYTSRDMCLALIREVKRLGIPVREGRNVVRLLTLAEGSGRRVAGAVAMDDQGGLEVVGAENVVFAVGGPGGLYKTSVYPAVHTGAIGVGLLAGAYAANLTESQYGMSSIGFRWNVSGTYMQVVPRVISTAADGTSEPREFLREYFDDVGQLCSQVFLKGYQWPFDSRKVLGGSSLVDIFVYVETVERGRRAFLDFRSNPEGFRFEDLSPEAFQYLEKSKALLPTPIARLRQMNPKAIELYAEHGIDITVEPLEIGVCAQHNNGGLAGNHWWESVNLKHLFPVGEVNGAHGVYRPGGASLNAGQVGSLRAAEYIANRYAEWTVDAAGAAAAARTSLAEIQAYLARCARAPTSWQQDRDEFQRRMSRAAAHVRSPDELETAVGEAWHQFDRLDSAGCSFASPAESGEALRNLQLCYAHAVYLEAVAFAVRSGVGSRGSAIVLDPAGQKLHDKLDDRWRIAPEDLAFRKQVLETQVEGRKVENRWIPCRPIPETDLWFETAWASFRKGEIYDI